jgi:hypothetical protein
MVQASGVVTKTYKNRGKYRDGPFGRRYYAIIYAIGSPNGGPIKFGRTTDIEKRFGGISTMSPVPLDLIGYVWMPDDAEAYVHGFLEEDRSHGEWFHRTEKTRALAALISAKKDVEIAEIIGLTWTLVEHVPSGVSWGRT